jgi:hypothetical protein
LKRIGVALSNLAENDSRSVSSRGGSIPVELFLPSCAEIEGSDVRELLAALCVSKPAVLKFIIATIGVRRLVACEEKP